MSYIVVAVLMLLAAKIVISAECSYEGNMCDADAECMVDIAGGYACYNMTHEKVYKSSSPRKFTVYIFDKTSYPEDVTVTVLRFYNNKYTTVPGCCDLKSNDSCMLPPSDDADYVIVAPALEVESDFLTSPPFCLLDVSDKDLKLLKWCHIDRTAPCKYIKGDTVLVNNSFEDSSTVLMQKNLTYDLCLFDAPIMKADGFSYFDDDGLSYDVSNVEGNPDEMCSGEGNGKIIRKLNRRQYLNAFKERAPPGYTRCVFEREIGYLDSPPWSVKPNCHAHGTPEAFPVWSIILVVIIIAVILVFIMIAIYRRYADAWFPEYKIPPQLTEVLSNTTEKRSEERMRKDTEIIVVDGKGHKVMGSTLERYSRTPVRSSKFIFNDSNISQEMVDTELILPQNGDNDEITGAAETPDNILQNFDDSTEKNTADDELNDGDQSANIGYALKHHDFEGSCTTNGHGTDFNGNNILSNTSNVEYVEKEQILNSVNGEFGNFALKNTASQFCSSVDFADRETMASIDAINIIYPEPYKNKSIYFTQEEDNFKEGAYVRKYK